MQKQIPAGHALLVSGARRQATSADAAGHTRDYVRAAGMLGDHTGPLVDHLVSAPAWLDDGGVVYRGAMRARHRPTLV
ncbi:MAG: hypothetical protein U1F19_03445 [Lysobacterales bacterium]